PRPGCFECGPARRGGHPPWCPPASRTGPPSPRPARCRAPSCPRRSRRRAAPPGSPPTLRRAALLVARRPAEARRALLDEGGNPFTEVGRRERGELRLDLQLQHFVQRHVEARAQRALGEIGRAHV